SRRRQASRTANRLNLRGLPVASSRPGPRTRYGSVMTLHKLYVSRSTARSLRIGRIVTTAVAFGALCLVGPPSRALRAQTEESSPPHRMLLTPERALAAILATDR